MNNDLFPDVDAYQPLAARMRPTSLQQFVGQQHILGEGKPLREALEKGAIHSMILWGPPGVGKTTLAKIVANIADARFETISAVLSGVKEIRASVAIAQQERAQSGRKTILFVDEVHRFNKAQQDAFLPYIEDGTILFIGATTENPSFELNNALLSRCRVYVMRSLQTEDIEVLLQLALTTKHGLGDLAIHIDGDQLDLLASAADGDARTALNLLEITTDLAELQDGQWHVSADVVKEALGGNVRRFDKGGEYFYDQISAMHKSVRGSSPDAALYWFARMIDGGCDPLYIARRVVRMASEDIGNADPRALQIALNGWETQERLGSPEGELAIAQAVIYMAVAPKSNAVYKALGTVMKAVREGDSHEVPLHLHNEPTKLMKELDYGTDYRYAHDEDQAYTAGENYFPDALKGSQYYFPVERGMEIKIKEKLDYLRSLDTQSVKGVQVKKDNM